MRSTSYSKRLTMNSRAWTRDLSVRRNQSRTNKRLATVARLNCGLSVRRAKNRRNLTNDARIDITAHQLNAMQSRVLQFVHCILSELHVTGRQLTPAQRRN